MCWDCHCEHHVWLERNSLIAFGFLRQWPALLPQASPSPSPASQVLGSHSLVTLGHSELHFNYLSFAVILITLSN